MLRCLRKLAVPAICEQPSLFPHKDGQSLLPPGDGNRRLGIHPTRMFGMIEATKRAALA